MNTEPIKNPDRLMSIWNSLCGLCDHSSPASLAAGLAGWPVAVVSSEGCDWLSVSVWSVFSTVGGASPGCTSSVDSVFKRHMKQIKLHCFCMCRVILLDVSWSTHRSPLLLEGWSSPPLWGGSPPLLLWAGWSSPLLWGGWSSPPRCCCFCRCWCCSWLWL